MEKIGLPAMRSGSGGPGFPVFMFRWTYRLGGLGIWYLAWAAWPPFNNMQTLLPARTLRWTDRPRSHAPRAWPGQCGLPAIDGQRAHAWGAAFGLRCGP
eukprot:1158767-Pelagomonas_calceolata.AAC.5